MKQTKNDECIMNARSFLNCLVMTRQQKKDISQVGKERADLRSQECRYAWYSHISSQFVMVKQ